MIHLSTTARTILAAVGYLGVALPSLWHGCWKPSLRATLKPDPDE